VVNHQHRIAKLEHYNNQKVNV